MVGYAPPVIGAQPDNNCRGPSRHNETTGTQCADPYSTTQPTSITQRQGLCQALWQHSGHAVSRAVSGGSWRFYWRCIREKKLSMAKLFFLLFYFLWIFSGHCFFAI